MMNIEKYQNLFCSKKKALAGFIPYPRFEFLMGLALLLCLAWFYYVPGSMPLA